MPLNPIKLLLNSKNPPFLVSGVLGSDTPTQGGCGATLLSALPNAAGVPWTDFALQNMEIAPRKSGSWNFEIQISSRIWGFFIITTRSSRKRLNIANKRRRELGKPRRCNDLVSLGPSGINLWEKLTGSWKIGTPALFCFPFSHMESEMMDLCWELREVEGPKP